MEKTLCKIEITFSSLKKTSSEAPAPPSRTQPGSPPPDRLDLVDAVPLFHQGRCSVLYTESDVSDVMFPIIIE